MALPTTDPEVLQTDLTALKSRLSTLEEDLPRILDAKDEIRASLGLARLEGKATATLRKALNAKRDEADELEAARPWLREQIQQKDRELYGSVLGRFNADLATQGGHLSTNTPRLKSALKKVLPLIAKNIRIGNSMRDIADARAKHIRPSPRTDHGIEYTSYAVIASWLVSALNEIDPRLVNAIQRASVGETDLVRADRARLDIR